jgi:GT2 family glycosyltransferase
MAKEILKIGIPVLNRGDLLERLVRSIDLDAEVLIIANRIGSMDPTVEGACAVLEERPPSGIRLQVERIDGNLGVSGSWNRIIENFSGNCWVVNSDIEFTAGVLKDATKWISKRRNIVLHHLWAGACFYVTDLFTSTLGWFDENFYPAYHEDEEMTLRARALGVRRSILGGIGRGRILHERSQTVKSASRAQRLLIREGHHFGGTYLFRRWGPQAAQASESRYQHPFGDSGLHPADWTLDLEVRKQLARRCEELTNASCPIIYHKCTGAFDGDELCGDS